VVPKLSKAKEYYAPPKEKPKEHYIMYHTPNKWYAKNDIVFEAHGFRFREGIVYKVDDLVFEWSKRQRGFFEVLGIEIDKTVGFK